LGLRLGAIALFLLAGHAALQSADAEGDTRTLTFHHLHTGEDITITYKRNGRYDEAALEKLNWFMRDWRKEQETKMDPHLFDILWEAYRDVGGKEPIQIVCGYRSSETNSMLRARSSGVAQFSQHINGNAIDFYIPGVPLEKLREAGLRLQRGGVGFYPTSGSPFVHLDTGTIRHWPRMTHDQLARVFPDGRTVHVPSDGVPLANYQLALADIESRGNGSEEPRMASTPKRGLLARIFSGKQRDEDEISEQPAPKEQRADVIHTASVKEPVKVTTERIVKLPTARPKLTQVAAAEPKTKADTKPANVAALASAIFDSRVAWRGSVETGPDLPPAKAEDAPFKTASVEPATTGSAGHEAMAYAPETVEMSASRAAPMGATVKSQIDRPIAANTTIISKPPLAAAMSQLSGTLADPWLRAVTLTPSVTTAMTTTTFGPADARNLTNLILKPTAALVMTFSADPNYGMVSEKFTGKAAVFLATATFSTQTASLSR
jgi:uncharacterized protein YcbK (DUF882 family)